VNAQGYTISAKCTACGACSETCPVRIIKPGDIYSIEGKFCLECGLCVETCPEEAIEPAQGM
jgi:formate hydrogenlyase subunit 6/NADH:ubiquinone oxidoreductase subunit I